MDKAITYGELDEMSAAINGIAPIACTSMSCS
jgi:hypothetical protein